MELTKKQNQLIEGIAKENAFQDFKLSVEEGTQKGDNFLGKISRITLEEKSKKLFLILKGCSTNEIRRKIQSIREFFLREMYIYDAIFPEFAAYEEQFNITNRFAAFAKFYGAIDEDNCETILFEDMKEKGYQMCNKRTTMNCYHIEAVLTNYAKFHSISLSMRSKNPDHFKKLTGHLTDILMKSNEKDGSDYENFFEPLFQHLFESVKDYPVETKALKKLEIFLENSDLSKNSDPNDFLIVTHGDCWCNNFLFNYKDENKEKPSDVCIVDWQWSKLGSPGMDLSYFLFANGSEEILNDYKKYLKIYYNVLQQHLQEFSLDPDEILSYEALESQFNKHSISTLFLCALVFKIVLNDPELAPDFEEIKDVNYIKTMLRSDNNVDEYYKRLGCIVKFLVNNNILPF